MRLGDADDAAGFAVVWSYAAVVKRRDGTGASGNFVFEDRLGYKCRVLFGGNVLGTVLRRRLLFQ